MLTHVPRFLSPHLVALLRLWLVLTTLSGIWTAILLVPVPPLLLSFAEVGCIEAAKCYAEVRFVRWPTSWRRTSSMSSASSSSASLLRRRLSPAFAALGHLGLQEGLLGVAEGSLEAYYVALDEHLAAKGLSWTGKGTSAVTKAAAHLATRRPAAARHPNSPNRPGLPL